MIKDILLDLTKTTRGIDFDMIKCVPQNGKPNFYAMSGDGNILMKASCHKEIPEFDKVFGLGNLDILRGYLDVYNSYDTSVPVSVDVNKSERNGETIPTDITFKAKGQSSANYRLIAESVVKKMRVMTNTTWDATVTEISKAKIQEFKKFSSIMSRVEKKFSVKAKDGKLTFIVGDHASSVSNAEIAIGDVEGDLKSQYKYPTDEFLTILNQGNPVIKFADKGIGLITIDTGLFDYQFSFQGGN